MINTSDILDDIATTVALIDQAQAHLDASKHLLTPEQFALCQSELLLRRSRVEDAKFIITTLH